MARAGTPSRKQTDGDGSLLSRLAQAFTGRTETRAAPPTSWDLIGMLGLPTLTGGLVSPAAVEGNAAAFAAITVISEAVGLLPARVYRKLDDDNREPAPAHAVQRLFAEAPNDLQTP